MPNKLYDYQNFTNEYKSFMGMDLTRIDVTTPAEIAAFSALWPNTDKVVPGFDIWLKNKPDVLKRFLYQIPPFKGVTQGGAVPYCLAYLAQYAYVGFVTGSLYELEACEMAGHTKAQVLEALAFCHLISASRGFTEVSPALIERLDRYREPDNGVGSIFYENWAPDSKAFEAGLDYSNPHLLDEEWSSLKSWYKQYMGEVPASVQWLATYEPDGLKAWRLRWENAVGTALPKQMMPWMMISFDANRGFQDGIREGVQLARGFGMTLEQTTNALHTGIDHAGPAVFFDGGTLLRRHPSQLVAKVHVYADLKVIENTLPSAAP